MSNRYERKFKKGKGSKGEGPGSKVQSSRSKVEVEGPRMIACGKINKYGRETHIAFELMGDPTKSAIRRVFTETARGEEIANA